MTDLHVFFQNTSSSLQMLTLTQGPRGLESQAPMDVSNIALWDRPSVVVQGGDVHLFYLADKNTGQLNCISRPIGSAQWSVPQSVLYAGADCVPSAVSCMGQLYVFFQMGGNLFYVSQNVGNTWSSPICVQGAGLTQSPSATVNQDEMVVFYQGENNAGTLWQSTVIAGMQQASGSRAVVTPAGGAVGISCSPAAVQQQPGDCFVFHQGHANSQNIWCYSPQSATDQCLQGIPAWTSDGIWGSFAALSVRLQTQGSPAACEWEQGLALAWNDQGVLNVATCDKKSGDWNLGFSLPGIQSNPCLAVW